MSIPKHSAANQSLYLLISTRTLFYLTAVVGHFACLALFTEHRRAMKKSLLEVEHYC